MGPPRHLATELATARPHPPGPTAGIMALTTALDTVAQRATTPLDMAVPLGTALRTLLGMALGTEHPRRRDMDPGTAVMALATAPATALVTMAAGTEV